MTVTVDTAPDATEQPVAPGGRPAGWWARAGAFSIDVLFGLGLLATILLIGLSAPAWGFWVCMVFGGAVLLAVLANRTLLPAATGWSLGRSLFGIAVVRRDGKPIGPWRLLARDAAHLIDTVPLFLGWLWPLIDSRGRTFADLITGTEVRAVDGPVPDRGRLAERLIAGIAAASVMAAVLGYALVYRPQQAAEQARAQLSTEGPKIVADMLSYTAKTADDDFARAQKLVTDGYRPELTKQQESVRKIGLTDNDYWATNSAVVSATANRATMLMLLQGQRGIAPKQRFIIASVRVSFEKSGGQWLVSDLAVLSPPKPTQPSPPATPAPSASPGPGAPAPSGSKPPAPPAPKPSAPAPSGGGR